MAGEGAHLSPNHSVGQKSKQAQLGFCLGSHEAEIKLWAGLSSPLEALGKNPLLHSSFTVSGRGKPASTLEVALH